MSQNYTVQQGDQISGIAEKFGFTDYRAIWNHSNNAALKQKRKNAHVLYPGDVIHVPDKKQKWEPVATTRVHTFKMAAEPLQLRLVLKDFDEQPMANLNCVLEVEGAEFQLKSDGGGLIWAEIPRGARAGTLRIPDLDIEMPVAVGELDPPEEESGWIMRLINLGYHENDVDDDDEERLRSAIEEFQCDQKLKITGKPDDATRQKLKDVHGS